MNLYNMLFGVNSAAPILLKTLGITSGDVPRFRDCYVEGDTIVIHTRTGGGNREGYEAENDALTKIPGYVCDADDDYDCTYANFYYLFPAEYAADLKALSAKSEGHKPSEKWEALFDSLKSKPPTAAPDSAPVESLPASESDSLKGGAK